MILIPSPILCQEPQELQRLFTPLAARSIFPRFFFTFPALPKRGCQEMFALEISMFPTHLLKPNIGGKRAGASAAAAAVVPMTGRDMERGGAGWILIIGQT